MNSPSNKRMKRLQYTLKIAAIVLSLIAPAYGESDVLRPDEWPTTVDAVVQDILSSMPEKDKENIMNTAGEDLIKFHHGWGTGIRNYYGLWRGNDELVKSACGNPCHPDDASMAIIRAVWKQLQNRG